MNEKVVLITGASSGIGFATAEKLIEDGYIVCAAARRVEKMKDLEDLGATIFSMDITKENDINEVVSHISSEYGGVDILINNAGFGMYGAMEDIPIEDARYQFEVNLFGLAYLTQQVLPNMREKRYGKIVNISSIGGKIYTPLGSWYHATKHAIEGWSDCLRLELASFNIDVIIIEPGLIATNFGHIVLEKLSDVSGDGPYADITKIIGGSFQTTYGDKTFGSPPSVVAEAIAKSVSAKKPKTRYAVGKRAKLVLFMRKYFSDRFFDRNIMKMAK